MPFLFHILCSLHFYKGSFSYTSYAGFFFSSGEFLLNIPCWVHFDVGREFLLHIWMCKRNSKCSPFFIFSSSFFLFFLNLFYLGSFSYTSHVCFISLCGFSLTRPMLASFLSGEFLLYIPCWLHFYLASFSYTSHVCFISLWGVSLTRPMLALFLSGEFLLYIQCWLHFYLASFSYTSRAGFIIIWLHYYPKHPMLASFSGGEFL